MCSIFGYISSAKIKNIEKLKKSSLLMKHRGPDNSGYFIENNVFLAHNRLSIIDLEKNSNQPFVYDDLVMVFNGEIYNYKELKEKYLQEFEFKTSSDTEVLILMYKKFKKECLKYIKGMFAFVIYDKNENIFFCARDRVGEKPFVYFLDEEKFIFSSEIPAILNIVNSEINKKLEPLYFSSFKSFPAPYTYYENIYKLEPASYMIIKNNKIIEKDFYWNLKVGNYKKITPLELKEKVLESIKLTAVSDVPIAILLSGGVDSSIIAYALKEFNINFRAYCFGKDENDEELKRAKLVANYLDIELKEVYFESNDLEVYKKLIKAYGEPTFLLPLIFAYKLYEKIYMDGYKVVLTGNGADELFFGYVSHPMTALYSYIKNFFISKSNTEVKKERTLNSMFLKKDKKLLDDLFSNYDKIFKKFEKNYYVDFTNFVALFLEGALPMTIIGDLCGMQHSLEVRNPFFNSDLIEFAYNIPPSQKIGNYFDKKGVSTKKILKDAFKNDLPQEVFEAKKIGFGGNVREDNIFGENGIEKFAKWSMEKFMKERNI
jgi:asparagine synthase (glutamine-hydrolysing)